MLVGQALSRGPQIRGPGPSHQHLPAKPHPLLPTGGEGVGEGDKPLPFKDIFQKVHTTSVYILLASTKFYFQKKREGG